MQYTKALSTVPSWANSGLVIVRSRLLRGLGSERLHDIFSTWFFGSDADSYYITSILFVYVNSNWKSNNNNNIIQHYYYIMLKMYKYVKIYIFCNGITINTCWIGLALLHWIWLVLLTQSIPPAWSSPSTLTMRSYMPICRLGGFASLACLRCNEIAVDGRNPAITSWYIVNILVFTGFLKVLYIYIPGSAGFLPSRVAHPRRDRDSNPVQSMTVKQTAPGATKRHSNLRPL